MMTARDLLLSGLLVASGAFAGARFLSQIRKRRYLRAGKNRYGFNVKDPVQTARGNSSGAEEHLTQPDPFLSPAEASSYKERAEAGDAEGQYLLGVACREGDGAAKDYAAAIAWLRKAAKQGHLQAVQLLHLMYYLDEGVPHPHSETEDRVLDAQERAARFQWFLSAAGEGDPAAQYEVAKEYRFGLGAVEADREEAICWLRKAAEGGVYEAKRDLEIELPSEFPITQENADQSFNPESLVRRQSKESVEQSENRETASYGPVQVTASTANQAISSGNEPTVSSPAIVGGRYKILRELGGGGMSWSTSPRTYVWPPAYAPWL